MEDRDQTRLALHRGFAKAALLLCLLSSLLGGFSGCSWVFGSSERIDTRAIDIQIPPGANHDWPVAIDIVYVFDDQVAKQLQSLSAADWFRQRNDIGALYPGKLRVVSYEFVPGQLGPIEHVTGKNTKAFAVFAFANYRGPGVHRARLDRFKKVVIRLGPDDVIVVPEAS